MYKLRYCFIGKNVNFEKKSTLPPRLQKQRELMSRDKQTSKYTQNEYADDDSDGFQRYVKKKNQMLLYQWVRGDYNRCGPREVYLRPRTHG